LIGDALNHRGFGFIDILQPCVTYNRINTFDWYKERVYDLALEAHNPADADAARARILEWPTEGEVKQIPIGIFYSSRRDAYESCGLMQVRTSSAAPSDGGRGGQRQSADPVSVVKKAMEEFE
jgi:2-oxoglutarate ferredoxin oxidoreductase subunit beta